MLIYTQPFIHEPVSIQINREYMNVAYVNTCIMYTCIRGKYVSLGWLTIMYTYIYYYVYKHALLRVHDYLDVYIYILMYMNAYA